MTDDPTHSTPPDLSGETLPEKVDSLRMIVEQEAKRALSDAQFEPDPELVAEGWERRFMADARQAKDAIDLYTELGFEVLAVPVRPAELADECEGCRIVVAFQFQTIYTRKK